MTKRTIVAAMLAATALSSPASAADVPVKAQRQSLFGPAYPTTQGLYFGVGTLGGGGTVNASVGGVNSNSLVSNQIGVAGIIGYAWNMPNTPMFAAVEGWFGWQNFNGSGPGFNLTGPAT